MFKFTGTKSELDNFLKSNFTTPPIITQVSFSAEDLALHPLEKLLEAHAAAKSLLDAGKGKIEAIKQVRAVTSKGLKEAKDFVEYHFPEYASPAITY